MSPDNKSMNEADIETIVKESVELSGGNKANIVMDSQILTGLMTCPRMGDFRFNHNLISIAGKSNSLEVGSIVHTFLEYFNRALIKGVKRDQAAAFGFTAAQLYISGCKGCMGFEATPEIPKPLCGHKPDEFPGLQNTQKDSEGYKTGWQWALDTCDQYVHYYRNDHWVPLEVEVVKGEVLYEDDEVRILWKAKLDLTVDTNQGIYPVDHKTMKQRRDTISMNNQFIGQCLLMKTRNVFIDKIGFQTTLKPEEKFTRPPVSYSAARLFEWQSEILPFWGKMLLLYAQSGYYPPNFNGCEGKYGKCGFLEVCEADPNMREHELKRLFKVGPEWNPTNDESGE